MCGIKHEPAWHRILAWVGDFQPQGGSSELGYLGPFLQREHSDISISFRRFIAVEWNYFTEELLVVRDPLGMETIYFAQLGSGGVAVASRARALTSLADVSRAPDAQTFAEVLTGIPRRSGATCFSQVKELPRACALRVRVRGFEVTRYFSFSGLRRDSMGADRSRTMALEINDSVNGCLLGAIQPSVTLSGGLDSTSIYRVASGLVAGGVSAITAKFPNDPDANEDEYLESALGNVQGRSVCFEPSVSLPIGRLLELVDSPEWIPLASVTVSCATIAREMGFDLMLTGEFGDYLGGALKKPISWLLRAGQWEKAIALTIAMGGGRNRMVLRFIRSITEAYLPYLRSRSIRRNVHFQNARQWMRLIAPRKCREWSLAERLHDDWSREFDPNVTFADRMETFFDERVRTTTGASWAAERFTGVRVEHPFASIRIAALASTMNFDERWANGRNRALLREAMRGIVPPKILERQTKARLNRHHKAFLDEVVGGGGPLGIHHPLLELLELRRPMGRISSEGGAVVDRHGAALFELSARWLRMLDSRGTSNELR